MKYGWHAFTKLSLLCNLQPYIDNNNYYHWALLIITRCSMLASYRFQLYDETDNAVKIELRLYPKKKEKR